jgi:ABC-2 type transport system permease protein
MPVLLMFVLIYWQRPSWYVLAFPVAVLIQATFLVGIGLMLAPLAVLYGDVERLMRIVLRLLFYFSPIIYGLSDVTSGRRHLGFLAKIYILNPFAGIIELYRAAFFPGEWVGWTAVGVAAVVSVAMLVVGIRVFGRLEGTVLKEI